MPATILRPYYLGARNRFIKRDSTKHSVKRDLLMLFVTFLVMLCIFVGFVMILKTLAEEPVLRELIPQKILELLFYAFFILLMFSNTIAAMGNLYSAENMNLFLTTPVSSLRLFSAKLFETIVETSLMFFVFLLPVGLAYCYTLDIRPWFFIGSAVITFPFLVIPASLAFVLATIFVKLASIVWKRGYFFFLCIVGIGAWVASSLVALLKQVQLERGGQNAIIQMIGLFDNPSPNWLPSRWAADLISYFITGSVDVPLLKLLLLWGSAVGSVAIAFLFFDLFLLPVRSAALVHERTHDPASGGKKDVDFVRKLLEFVYLRIPIPVQVRAIILKDLSMLVRDRAQSLQLLMYLGIAVLYIIIIKFMSAALSMSPIALQAWWGFLASINILFAGFIITAIMTRLVYPSISLEGKAFWILITGPIKLEKLIAAKFWCWIPLTVIVAETLMLAGVLAVNPSIPLALSTMFVGFWMSIGCTGLAVGVGSIFASFEWESPNQISAGFGTLVLLLSSLTLVLLTSVPASVLTFLTVVPAARIKLGVDIWQNVMALCALLIVLVNLLAAYYFCKKGAASLALRNSN